MNDRAKHRWDRLTRVQTFGRENANDFAAGSKVKTHFFNVDQHLKHLDGTRARPKARAPQQAVKTAKAALRAKFVAYELPADFVTDLRADREAVREANKHNQGVENTSLIGQILGKAADDVQELDAIMNNKYSRQPEKLRAWQSASRVERAPQREKKPEPIKPATAPAPK